MQKYISKCKNGVEGVAFSVWVPAFAGTVGGNRRSWLVGFDIYFRALRTLA
jgi:hypothetical protein